MRLALGTVQFGTSYGVANLDGQVSMEEMTSILKYSTSIGINELDTASSYGTSESALGEFGMDQWKIITKLAPLDQSVVDVESWTVSQVNASLTRLGVKSLEGVLLHQPQNILSDDGISCLRALTQLRDAGVIQSIGYSIYSPEILNLITKRFWPDVVQAPFNVFDQRIRSSGWLEKLALRGTKVYARSVFLQGLLLMPYAGLPIYFSKWSNLLSKWEKITHLHAKSPLEVALGFALSEPRFERIIVGVNKLSQLKELVKACNANQVAEVAELACSDPNLIEPFRWKI